MIACLQYGIQQENHDVPLSINGLFALIQTSATDQVAPRYIPIAFSFATLGFGLTLLIRRFPDELAVVGARLLTCNRRQLGDCPVEQLRGQGGGCLLITIDHIRNSGTADRLLDNKFMA